MTGIINEEWRSINSYLNYQVSNIGRVRNVKTSKILKPNDVYGYQQIRLWEYKKPKMHYIHKLVAREFIENPLELSIIDHIDGNPRNNVVTNLRFCTQSQNCMNAKIQTNTSSRFKGVGMHKRFNLWQVRIMKDGRSYHLGYFDDEVEAAKIYNKKAIELFGEFANLNVIPDEAEKDVINKIQYIINKLENEERPDFTTVVTLCEKLKNLINYFDKLK